MLLIKWNPFYHLACFLLIEKMEVRVWEIICSGYTDIEMLAFFNCLFETGFRHAILAGLELTL